MKIWQRMMYCTAAALLALGPTGPAEAVSVSGRASTEVEWFDTAEGETAVPVYQYLLFNAKDLGAPGVDFRFYGRLADDVADETEFADSRLYYAYLEKNGLAGRYDLRLGRQFISTTAGASLMDGLRLRVNDLGPVKLEVFGGGDVAYYEGYNAKDLIGGAEVSGRFFDRLDLGLSYLQKWEGGNLGQELVGLDASYEIADVLQLYNETQYSWLTEEVTYFLLGAQYHRSPKWSLRTEYLYSLPVFSSTSIYSVFAASEYQEATAELNYHITTGLNAFGRYTREIYDEFDDSNVFEAGVEKIRTERFSGYLTGVWRDNAEGDDLAGVKARAAYLFCPSFEGGVGASIDVLERRLEDDEDETTSSRLWADATLHLTRKVNLQGRVERVESNLWDDYYRGRVRLNVTF